MKKIFYATLIVASIFSEAFAANWQEVTTTGTNADGNFVTYSYDRDRLSIKGNALSAWVKYQYLAPKTSTAYGLMYGKEYDQVVENWNIRCEEKSVIIAYKAFRNSFSNDSESVTNPSKYFVEVEPETVAESLVNKICANAKKR